MRELQSISHELLVTSVIVIVAPTVKDRQATGPESASRRKRRSRGRPKCPASVLQWARLRGGMPCSLPTIGPAPQSFGSQFGSQATKRERAFECRAAPRVGLEPTAYCLGGTFVTSLDDAIYGLTCRWPVPAAAPCGLTSPGIYGRWLTVRLPAASLATLMF